MTAERSRYARIVRDRDGLKRLARGFFDRPATEVAPDLLDCILWHASPAGLVAARLVEVEAYRGAIDPASHAFRGRTGRNAVMFGPPGHAYVYFSYGMHYCVNLVCEPPGSGEAVLIRAAAIVAGEELARRRRSRLPGASVDADVPGDGSASGTAGRGGTAGSQRPPGREGTAGHGSAAAANGGQSRRRDLDLARGPGRLCQALGIDLSLDGADVCGPGGPLGISPPTALGPPLSADREVRTGPRVGISRAADLPWRYWLAGDGHVSAYRSAKQGPRRPKPVNGRGAEDGTMHE